MKHKVCGTCIHLKWYVYLFFFTLTEFYDVTHNWCSQGQVLKSRLAQAKKKAEMSKAATDKVAKELEVEWTTHEHHELTKALESVKESRVEAQGALQEI